jgi:hypothetical protein
MSARPLPFSWLPGDPCVRAMVAACLLAGALSLVVALDYGGYPHAPNRFWILEYHVRLQDVPGAALLIALVIAAGFAPGREAALRLVDAISRHPGRAALAAFAVLCLGALIVERAHPLAQDEYAALFQSRAFAAGRLTGQFPPELVARLIPPWYLNQFLYASLQTGEVASAYWPGFALLMTPFSLLGVPWACNPFLASAALLLMGRIATRLSGEPQAAGWAMLLALASPGFTAMAMTYFSMNAHLLLNLVFAWLLIERSTARLVAAGAVGSLALLLHNPLPHTLFALPWIVWLALQPGARRNLLALAAGYAPLALLLGFGWAMLLSHLQGPTAYALLPEGGSALDRLANFLWGWHIRMRSALPGPGDEVLAARAAELMRLWNWAVPGLPLLAAAGWWLARGSAPARLLGLSALCTGVGYLFIGFNQGNGWGARYFHPAWGTLPVLAALALAGVHRIRGCERLGGYVALLAVLSLLAASALRAHQIQGFMDLHLAARPPAAPDAHRIVFVAFRRAEFSMDLVQNDPLLRGEVWYMMSYGAANDADFMRARFPGAQRELLDSRGSVWRVGPARRAPAG